MGWQCNPDKSPVPTGPVDIYLDLNQPEFNGFIPGTYRFIVGGGSGLGIVVYRVSQTEFKSFDRMCTSKTHQEPHRVATSEISYFLLECPACGSRFGATDGTIIRGPATYGLIEYQCFYNQTTNVLWITN